MKLELKHLAPYLPYQLPMYWEDFNNKQLPVYYLKPEDVLRVLEFQNKPILRPLSDLNVKEHCIFSTAEYNVDIIILSRNPSKIDIDETQWVVIQQLLKWHFDIFGLIEKGLAIDINSIENVSV